MIKNVISPEFNEEGRALRRVRSFVRRQGRLTPRQEQALEKQWPIFGIEYQRNLSTSVRVLDVTPLLF